MYNPYIVEYIEVDETIPSLVNFAQDHGLTYKDLKKHNPWLRRDKLTVKNGKQYLIAIPGP